MSPCLTTPRLSSYLRFARTIIEADFKTWEEGNSLSIQRLRQVAIYYYGKFELYHDKSDQETQDQWLGKHLTQWLKGLLDVTTMSHNENPVSWWIENEDTCRELSRLGAHLLGMRVVSASCERLFQDYQHHAESSGGSKSKIDEDTVRNCSLVLCNMHSKYQDSVPFSRNGTISVEEYARRNPGSKEPAAESQEATEGTQDDDDDNSIGDIPVLDHWLNVLDAVEDAQKFSSLSVAQEVEETTRPSNGADPNPQGLWNDKYTLKRLVLGADGQLIDFLPLTSS